MTCPNCRRVLPDTTPAEIMILRAQLADAERHRDALAQRLAELTCGEPDPLLMTAATTIAKLRAENARLTPTWRDGDPPAGVCWREGVRLPVEVMIHHDGNVWWYRSSSDVGDAWGTARWCPIARPT